MERFGLSAEEWTNLVLSVNTHRTTRRLSPAEVALLVQRALNKVDRTELSDALGLRDASMVSRFDSLNQLDPDLRDLVDWGTKAGCLSMSVASELAPLRPRSERRRAFDAALTHRFNKEEALQLAQSFRRRFGSMEACIEAALETRPRLERTEVIIGAVIDEGVRAILETMSPSQRKAAFDELLDARFPGVTRLGATLNVGHFSISIEPSESTRLREALGDERLEGVLSGALRDLVG